MKQLIFFLMLMIFCLSIKVSNAQNTGKIVYTSILDTHDFEELTGVLVFEGNNSFFQIEKEVIPSDKDGTSDEELTLEDPNNLRLNFNIYVGTDRYRSSIFRAYINRQEKNIFRQASYFEDGKSHSCVIVEKMGIMDWEIIDEFKNIGSFRARKASTSFRGRNYTAWFTTSVPMDLGPWIFHGLPGLILELYDETMEVQFYASNIETPYEVNEGDIVIPDEGEEITIDEYANRLMNLENELIQLILAKLPRGVEISEVSSRSNMRGIELEY